MSRNRIAVAVLKSLDLVRQRRNTRVEFLYSPARFSRPRSFEPPIEVAQPVVGELAGWWNGPENPAAVVVGLGYEVDKAVGALEYFEAGSAWAFVPASDDDRYDLAVRRANKTLWSFQPRPHMVAYRVSRPYECFDALESLVNGLRADARPQSWCRSVRRCCSDDHAGWRATPTRCQRWRISSGRLEQPLQRHASGMITGLAIQSG